MIQNISLHAVRERLIDRACSVAWNSPLSRVKVAVNIIFYGFRRIVQKQKSFKISNEVYKVAERAIKQA